MTNEPRDMNSLGRTLIEQQRRHNAELTPAGIPAHPPLVRTHSYAFVMEQQVGLRTNYLTWRSVVEQEPDINATWVPITYYKQGGRIEQMRFLPGIVRASLRSRLQTAEGLQGKKYDAILFNTYNPAVHHRESVHNQRAFLMFDVTPIHYDGMAHWYDHKVDRMRWLSGYKHRRVCEVFQAAAGLFVCSHWTAQSAIEDYGADPDRIHIIPFGVDTQLWHPIAPEQKPDDGIVRILFTGGDFERKGGDLLLRWARETQRKGWELHMVTRKSVEAPPGVVIHTNMGNNAAGLIELAQKCDIFALPTRADCYSIASLEAMAVGLPVITCSVGGIPDIVREGKTGFLLEPDDYDGLVDRLHHLIGSPEQRRAMGEKGREVACTEFEAQMLVRRGLSLMAGD